MSLPCQQRSVSYSSRLAHQHPTGPGERELAGQEDLQNHPRSERAALALLSQYQASLACQPYIISMSH
ncbi:hypothetical protein AGOR_G00081560 [Albula goreensis]|uniref:Uncharacterized protein n=1 Tax=Albula goreensis TaxID=1534307 RepID=A0A8T3DQP5_9TELE|nr:hypothetical protein AGOR_G00081560 [Albula goreensis]